MALKSAMLPPHIGRGGAQCTASPTAQHPAATTVPTHRNSNTNNPEHPYQLKLSASWQRRSFCGGEPPVRGFIEDGIELLETAAAFNTTRGSTAMANFITRSQPLPAAARPRYVKVVSTRCGENAF